jgi:hypothetical protein
MEIGDMPEIIAVNPCLALNVTGFTGSSATGAGNDVVLDKVDGEVNPFLHHGN